MRLKDEFHGINHQICYLQLDETDLEDDEIARTPKRKDDETEEDMKTKKNRFRGKQRSETIVDTG